MRKLAMIVGLLVATVTAAWAVPQFLDIQGTLIESGTPVDGPQTVTFKIFNTETGGSYLFSETDDVSFSTGVFNVFLGTNTTGGIPLSVFDGADKYVQLTIGTTDYPRLRIMSVGYAFRAAQAEALAPGATAQFELIDITTITANVITAASSITASAFFGDGSHLTGIASSSSLAGLYVSKASDTMSGPLTVPSLTISTFAVADFSDINFNGTNAGRLISRHGLGAIIGTDPIDSTANFTILAGAGETELFNVGQNGEASFDERLTIRNSSLTLTGSSGYIFTGSSITAGAFFGDGSHLTGITAVGETTYFAGAKTFGSSVTVVDAIAAGSSVTASSFFGDGSHLTGVTGTDSTKVSKAGDTMTGALNLSNSPLNLTGGSGNIVGQASMTASAFFGDGSHLTGIVGETPYFAPAKTYGSSVTVADAVLANSSVTASAFFGDGSHLSGVTGTDSSKVSKTGDAMTGALNLSNVALNATGSAGNIVSQASVTASAFFGDGSHLTGVSGTDTSKVSKTGDTMTGALNLSGAAINLSGASGNLVSQASVTASAFFGDGSHLTGVLGEMPYFSLSKTFGSSVTLVDALLAGSSMTASSFFGDGSHLTGVMGTDSSKVSKTGDTMSGNLNFTNAGISLTGTSGNIVGQASMTASAFFGDGSHLTGIVTGSESSFFAGAKTYGSSITVANAILAGSSMTASAFFGDGSHLTGLASSESNTFTSSKTFGSGVLVESTLTVKGAIETSELVDLSTGTLVIKAGDNNTSSGDSGSINIAAGDSAGNGAPAGGSVSVSAGRVGGDMGGSLYLDGGVGSTGGKVALHGGAFASASLGGAVILEGSHGNVAGGSVFITGGDAPVSGDGGSITLTAGNGAADVSYAGGNIILNTGEGGSGGPLSGVFQVNGSTFVIKKGRVGVGTSTPTATLDIVGQIKGSSEIIAASSVTAAAFFGDGSHLSGISGGACSIGSGVNSVLCQGGSNTAGSAYSVVAGGFGNTASGKGSAVSGGISNVAAGDNSSIGGGGANQIDGSSATIGGGASNHIGFADYGVIGGGINNIVDGQFGTVGGGTGNGAVESASVGGGETNIAGADHSMIGGGQWNRTFLPFGHHSVIGGGFENYARGAMSTVSGGSQNEASGSGSTVPGGQSNLASGAFSFAAGHYATASANGAFVWADDQSDPLFGDTTNQFLVRASGGVYLQTSTLTVTGEIEAQTSSITASAFFGDGSHLTNVIGTDSSKVAKTGDTMTGPLTLANAGLNLSGAAGSVVGQASVTASAFFGDGSHLTGLVSSEGNTYLSSKTFTLDVLAGSSITAAAFFGDGSHLTGIVEAGYFTLPKTFASSVTVGAAIVASSSVTASAFFGDGSHLSGAERNTFSSSKTFTSDLLVGSSVTASAFFGDGSHLANIGELNTFASSKTFSDGVGGIRVISSVTAGAFFGDGSHLSGIGIGQETLFLSSQSFTSVTSASFGLSLASADAVVDCDIAVKQNTTTGALRLSFNGDAGASNYEYSHQYDSASSLAAASDNANSFILLHQYTVGVGRGAHAHINYAVDLAAPELVITYHSGLHNSAGNMSSSKGSGLWKGGNTANYGTLATSAGTISGSIRCYYSKF